MFNNCYVFLQSFGSGSGSVLNQVSGSGSLFRIRIRIQEVKNDPQKYKKLKQIHVLKCCMSL
jgi:hypothetical protein